MNAARTQSIWRFNPITGYWVHVREVTPATAQGWLEVWSRDEPGVSFQLASRRPSRAPCKCEIGPVWSGSPVRQDSAWACDDCGRVIPCEPERRAS